MVNVLDTAEETSWQVHEEESKTTSWQHLCFSKATGIFSSRIKKRKKGDSKTAKQHFCIGTTWVEFLWSASTVCTWHKMLKQFVLPPPLSAVTWTDWSADTWGYVTHSGCFTTYILVVELFLTGNTWQILNVCHWSEVLKSVLTVRIASSFTCKSLNSATFRFFMFYFCSDLSSFPEDKCFENFTQNSKTKDHHLQWSCRHKRLIISLPLLYRISF